MKIVLMTQSTTKSHFLWSPLGSQTCIKHICHYGPLSHVLKRSILAMTTEFKTHFRCTEIGELPSQARKPSPAMKFTEGTQGGDIASYISGEWVLLQTDTIRLAKWCLEKSLRRNLLTSLSVLRNGNWCEIPLSYFSSLPRLWANGKTHTETKQKEK